MLDAGARRFVGVSGRVGGGKYAQADLAKDSAGAERVGEWRHIAERAYACRRLPFHPETCTRTPCEATAMRDTGDSHAKTHVQKIATGNGQQRNKVAWVLCSERRP
eukprot:418484-Rhodomonas_salina.2